jgi:hypothetical protein
VLRPVAVFATAGAVLFGGLATAGALPDPVQRTTADITSHVGIDLPGRTPARSEARVEVDPGRTETQRPTVPGPATTTVPSTPATPGAPVPAPAPTAVPPPSAPTVPTVPSLPLPAPPPTTVPNLLGNVLAPLAPTGPTGPEGPTAPHPVRDLLDHLLP